MRLRRKLLATMASISIIGVGAFAIQPAAHANFPGFDPGYLISDDDFSNKNSMTEAEIKEFILSKNASCKPASGKICLKDLRVNVTTLSNKRGKAQGGTGLAPWTIFYRAAQGFGVNPQVLIVTLQKEQSGVTNALAQGTWDKALGFACPDNKPCDTNYKGFGNQVYYAANRLQEYIKEPSGFPRMQEFNAGKPLLLWTGKTSCPQVKLQVRNKSTAALYQYTPHTPNQAAINAFPDGPWPSCTAAGPLNFVNYMWGWFDVEPAGYTKPTTKTDRIAGATRIETAVQVSKKAFPNGSKVAYIGRQDIVTDAQTASSLKDGPVLLVPTAGGIPDSVANRLTEMGTTDIIIIGGTASVSPQTEALLREHYKVQRLSGDTRTETSIRIAERWMMLHGTPMEIYVTGIGSTEGSIDAAVAGSLTKGPILTLTAASQASSWLQSKAPGVHVRAIGGPASVPQALLDGLGTGLSPRLSGDDRYATSVAVATHATNTGTKKDTLHIATGAGLADSAVAGTLSDGPLVLIGQNFEQPVLDFAKKIRPLKVAAVGGEVSVPKFTLMQVAQAADR